MTIEKLRLRNPRVVSKERPFKLDDMFELAQKAEIETLRPGTVHVLENDSGTATIRPFVDLDGEVRANIELHSYDGTPVNYRNAIGMGEIDGYENILCLGGDIYMFLHGDWEGSGEREELAVETIVVYRREKSRDMNFYLFG